MRNRWLSALLALVLALGAGIATVAVAQTTGDIDGTVADQNGAALPGVSVELKSPALLGARVAVTDAAGRFRFPALAPGTYSVTASLSGFTKAEKTGIRVQLGATATIPVTLSVSVKEEVVVTGEAPVVDITKTNIGTTSSIDTIQKLPLARNFASVAQRAPGTGTDAAGGATVYGATSLENQYVIDGVNTTGIKIGDQGKQLNQEFVQEVEVKTGGYEAEYGRALGGVINVITKSGGNEFHGDVFGYYDSPSVAAADAHGADRASAGLASANPAKRFDYGADLGGYFMKDRIWFFGAFDRVNRDEDQTWFLSKRVAGIDDPHACGGLNQPACTSGGTTYQQRTNLFSGKLTFRLGESNTIGVAAFGDPGNYNGRVITSTPGPASATLAQDDFGGTDVSAKYDGIFGTQFLAQAQFGYHQEKNDYGSTDPSTNNMTTYLKQQTGFTTESYPNSGFIGLPLNEQYKRTAFKLAGTFFVATHEIKLGGDYEDISSSFTQRYSGPAGAGARITRRFTAGGAERTTQHRFYGAVPLSLNCLQKDDTGLPPAPGELVPLGNCDGFKPGDDYSDPKTTNTALFLQDSWKVLKNLTINAGVRYENQKLKNYAGDTVVDLKNEWSPRLGIIWDPMNNGKSKMYGSYGRFYTTIPQDIQTRALGREATIILTNHSNTNVLDPISSSGPPGGQTGDFISPGLKGMYQDEIIAGLEYEFLPNWSFGMKGIYKALGRVVEDRCDVFYNPDISAILTETTDPYILLNQPTCALINVDGSSALNTIKDPGDPKCYPTGSVDPDTGNYKLSSPCEATQATRTYRGLEFDLVHRFSQSFFVQASYIYSKLEGNYSGNLSQTREGGQSDPNINADFDYPGLVTNSYGKLRNDTPHQFKLTGFYSFPFGLTTGLNFTFQSGRPRSLIGCPADVIACGNGYSQEGYIVPKGSYGRLPSIFEGDFHLEYALRLGQVAITPMIDIFNFLNRQGVTSEVDLYNNQGTATLNGPCTAPATDTQHAGQTGYFASCAPNSNYGKPIAWQAPRSIRFGARVSF